MPKEQSHFALALRAMDAAPSGPLRGAAEEYRDVFLAGAVGYDTPFYAPGDKLGRAVEKSGYAAHGEVPGDTVAPFRRLADQFRKSPKPEAAAFVAGLLTHRAADQTFHPLVGYFCGADTVRHYRFESILDCWFRDRPPVPRTVSEVYTGAGRSRLAEWMAAFFDGGPVEAYTAAIERHCRVQGLFGNGLVSSFVWVAGATLGGSLKTYRNLFYPSRPHLSPEFFEKPIAFGHPVTGERFNLSLEDLVGRYLERLQPWWLAWEEFIENPSGLEPFGPLENLSLDTVTDPALSARKTHIDLGRTVDEVMLAT